MQQIEDDLVRQLEHAWRICSPPPGEYHHWIALPAEPTARRAEVLRRVRAWITAETRCGYTFLPGFDRLKDLYATLSADKAPPPLRAA